MTLEQNTENMVEFYKGSKTCTVSFTSQKYINKIKKLYKKSPDAFEVFEINDDGSLYARIPLSWLKISMPRTKEMTEEQRESAAERFRKYREEKYNNANNESEYEEDDDE